MKLRIAILVGCFASINISQAQKIVLLEQFTNSGCSICATHDSTTYKYVKNNPTQLIAISYHTAFPYFDSMYLENMAESNARTAFYGISFVPYSIIDGNFYRNSTPNFNSVLSSTVGSRAAINPNYNIQAVSNTYSGNLLQCKIAFQSLYASNHNDSLRAHVVVIEEEVLKNSYAALPGNNTQNVYNYVMRKMLPNAGGSHLLNRTIGGTDTLNLFWNMQHIKDKSEVRVVAFVQNVNTQEIYNALLMTPIELTSIAETDNRKYEIKLYPNPAKEMVHLSILFPIKNAHLTVINALGEVVYSKEKITENELSISTDSFKSGMYCIQLKSNEQLIQKKLLVE
ncbi:MAG: T9SS type A sorting domain-containing protein [Bacteroidetes bacterium]|nr:T9SS type A sorting domain-containing protein [Bacteroidota bacterium]